MPGVAVLQAGTLLQEKLARLVEKKDVNGAMEKVIRMHFAARRCANHAVIGVNNRKPLVGGIGRPGRTRLPLTKLVSAIHCRARVLPLGR